MKTNTFLLFLLVSQIVVSQINHKYDYESGVPADHISLIDISTGSQLGCPSGTSNQHLIHNTAADNQTDIDIDDIDVSGILDFYLDVTAEQTTKNFRVEFRSSAGNFASAFDFAVGSIRFWQPGSPTTFTLLASYVVGTKYRFHVTLDNLNDLVDIEIFNDASGIPIVSLSALPFRNTGSHVIDTIRFKPIGVGAGTFNIDNFIADDAIIPTSELFNYDSCTTSLSTSDFEEVNYANIYPNPTKGYVTLSTKAPADVPTIIDMLGRKVSANITKLSQTNYQVDMSKLPPGVYFLRVVMADKKSVVKRLVRQ